MKKSVIIVLMIFIVVAFYCSYGYRQYFESADIGLSRINKTMTVREIRSILATKSCDIGSGLFQLEFSYFDGSKLTVCGGDLDEPPMYITTSKK